VTTVIDGPDGLLAAAGSHLGRSDWLTIDDERLARFAEAVGSTEATEFLTLSLSNFFLPQIMDVKGFSAGVNYGCDLIRFARQVQPGDRVRASAEMVEVSEVKGGYQTLVRITIEIEGADEPACVIDSLSRWLV
jgi:3-hydroxymyristoyl/3-hydroxydecanoyl-(acyl carrier protein) dehydratase